MKIVKLDLTTAKKPFNNLFVLFFIFFLTPVFPATTTPSKPRPVHASINTLTAQFLQTRHLKMIKNPLVSTGKIYFKFPHQLRWEIIKPYESLYILDSQSLKKYIMDLKSQQWELVEDQTNPIMQKVFHNIMAWTKNRPKKNSDFEVLSESLDEVTLQPISNDVRSKFVQKINLQYLPDNNLASLVTITEPNGDSMEIQFTNYHLNKKISEDIFSDKVLK